MPLRLLYRAAVGAAVPLISRFPGNDEARSAHRARLAAPGAMADWASTARDPARPLIWLHAASVGEGLQARAVAAELRAVVPDAQIAFTHFSPSALRLAETVPADYRGYLPYDRRDDMVRAVAALRPDVLAFSKLDLWPELATIAARSGCRVSIVAATVDPGSSRLRFGSRIFTRRGYRSVSLAGAVSADDAARLARLGVPKDRITITGDPRVDSVLAVLAERSGGAIPPDADRVRSTLVAGSTWPEDESVLLDAFVRVRSSRPGARLLVVPHAPTAEHLAGLTTAAAQRGLPDPCDWRDPAADDAALVAVSEVGHLAMLYERGIAAYVGGGFGARGIHSVLEPAGLARPVITGPGDRGVRDARVLAAAGALHRLDRTSPAADLARRWAAWLDDPAAAAAAGRAARAALDPDRGAARRSAVLLAGLLPATSS